MNKAAIGFALSAVAALAILASTAPAAPALGERPVKWEYCELKFTRQFGQPGIAARAGGPAAVGKGGNVSVRLTTTEQEVEGADWSDLADKLKAPAAKNADSISMQKLRVLNRLGADGWEIVEHIGSDGTTGNASWILKRRVP